MFIVYSFTLEGFVAQFRPEDDQPLAEVYRMYFVYILKSLKNGKGYVGMTSKSVGKRLEEHNLGSNLWTRHNRPFELKYYESFFCKADTVNRERFLKSGVGKRVKKILIENL